MASSLKTGAIFCLWSIFHSISQGVLQTLETEYMFAEMFVELNLRLYSTLRQLQGNL